MHKQGRPDLVVWLVMVHEGEDQVDKLAKIRELCIRCGFVETFDMLYLNILIICMSGFQTFSKIIFN